VQRSLLLFQNSLRSDETIAAYSWYLKRFLNFYKLKDYDSLVKIETAKLQIMLEDYIMDLKKKVNPNSVPTFFYPIKTFFEANDIELKWKKIKRLFPARIKKTGSEAWTNSDIEKMISCTTVIKNKALVHFLATTACRVGAIPLIKLKHLSNMPHGCKSVVIYEDSVEEYFAFLTPESSRWIDSMLEKRKADGEFLEKDSPLFRARYVMGIEKTRPMTKKAIEAAIRRMATKAGLRDQSTKKSGRFSKPIDHGFRKRYATILKLNEKIPVAITERLLGHMIYHDESGNKIQLDDAYMRATREQLFSKFLLAIPDLVISEEERQKSVIEKQRQRLDKLEIKEREIEKLKARFDSVEQLLERITIASDNNNSNC